LVRVRRTPILCGLLALALLGAAGREPDAAPPGFDMERPAAGRFLIATERIRGTIFHHSVVFLLSYSDEGALGVIVNRPTEIALHDVVQGAHSGSGMLYVGGPVDPTAVMVLVRAKVAPERAVQVAEDVFMTVDADILVDRTAQGGEGLRVYAGYSGWGAGQLDGEIARGDWIVAGAPTGSIFESSPEQLWKKLHLEHHRLIARTPVAGRRRAG
jgi:putative transcriptional regulator